jgi:hypothetical protein
VGAGLIGGKSSRSVAGTLRGAAADDVLLPGEYEKVVELLKKRGEKGHMILAQSEVRARCSDRSESRADSDFKLQLLDARCEMSEYGRIKGPMHFVVSNATSYVSTSNPSTVHMQAGNQTFVNVVVHPAAVFLHCTAW